MQFSTREDIEVPIDVVFRRLSDFEGFERAARRRGIEVSRTDRLTSPDVGMSWQGDFTLRGKPRHMEVTLQRLDPPVALAFDGGSRNLAGHLAIELVSLSARRTRVAVKLELRPLSLAARITLQSLRLAKSRTRETFRTKVREQTQAIERSYRRGAA